MIKLIGKITNPSVLCSRQLFAFGPDNVFWIECILKLNLESTSTGFEWVLKLMPVTYRYNMLFFIFYCRAGKAQQCLSGDGGKYEIIVLGNCGINPQLFIHLLISLQYCNGGDLADYLQGKIRTTSL